MMYDDSGVGKIGILHKTRQSQDKDRRCDAKSKTLFVNFADHGHKPIIFLS